MGGVSTSTHTKLPLLLWIGSAVFIVYGTTIPFNFVSSTDVAYEHLARLVWNPLISPETQHRVSITDFVANLLLFTPFGCFGMWALRRPRSAVARIALLVILSASLSASVEVTQLFTIDRISSLADVFANTLGGLAGATVGLVVGASAEAFVTGVAAAGMADASAFFPLLIATLLLCAGAWEPFDLTLDLGSIFPKLVLLLHDPLQFRAFSDEGVSLLQHALFASTLVVWLKQTRVHSSMKIALVTGTVTAIGAEACQLFVSSRMPGLWDAAVGVIGVLVGVAAGVDYWRTRRAPTPIRWCIGLFGLTALGVAMQQLSPFELARDARTFQWMPFRNYSDFTRSETVSHSAELLLSYIALPFGVMFAVRKPLARFVTMSALALAIAVPVEYLQKFVGGRLPDVTDIGLSVAGAWLGMWIATKGWPLFNEQIALLHRRAPVGVAVPVFEMKSPTMLPLAVAAIAFAAIVISLKLVLQIPGIPYNVAELFLNNGSVIALGFFATALLWIGAGATIVAIALTSTRRPYLILPIALVAVSLVSKMLISRAVTYESLDDILGANNIFDLVTRHGIWGEWWRTAFLRLGPDSIDFIERRVRYCALYSIPVVTIAVSLVPRTIRKFAPEGLDRTAWTFTALVAVTWVWISGAIVLAWAATDNLTELIAASGPLRVPGWIFLFGVFVIIAANVAVWRSVESSSSRWISALAISAVCVAASWVLLNAGLEPRVQKYSAVFSGAQFLLGPDRQHHLATATLFARWAVVYAGSVVVIAVGAWLGEELMRGLRTTWRRSAVPEAS
jgi:VanZ family protein